MKRITSLAAHVEEMGLAVAYTERRLEARGEPTREQTGPRLMVPALEGASPWAAAAVLLGEDEE